MKVALREIGVDCGPTREPMILRTPDAQDRIRATLSRPEIGKWIA